MDDMQKYVELDMSYTGLHEFFKGMFSKDVVELGIAVENLTVKEAELISLVASEYLYILIDMQTKDNVTEIVLMQE